MTIVFTNPRFTKNAGESRRKRVRIRLRLLGDSWSTKHKMWLTRFRTHSQATPFHRVATPLKLWSALAVACHEGCWLHPRARILTLMAVMNSDRVSGHQTLNGWHLPQTTGAWIFNDPRDLRQLTSTHDGGASPDDPVACLCDSAICVTETWQKKRMSVAAQSSRHGRTNRCTTSSTETVAGYGKHDALHFSLPHKLNNISDRVLGKDVKTI